MTLLCALDRYKCEQVKPTPRHRCAGREIRIDTANGILHLSAFFFLCFPALGVSCLFCYTYEVMLHLKIPAFTGNLCSVIQSVMGVAYHCQCVEAFSLKKHEKLVEFLNNVFVCTV